MYTLFYMMPDLIPFLVLPGSPSIAMCECQVTPVEWERLEFKQGWNPEAVLHTVCAFANDINNWGGGYIIIGLSAKDGIPQFPPVGIPRENFDRIQGEVISTCYKMQPNYLPITQPYEIDGKHILVIWVPAGDMRPYSVPSTLGSDGRRQYYVRAGSSSIVAKGDLQTRLIELAAKVPFDDRINQEATLNDLDLGLIREFLQEVKSDLFDESASIPFAELCRQMQIARGPVEALRPVNAGLLFFSKAPEKFFRRTWIEVAVHQNEMGRDYTSNTFKGPLHKQLRQCLQFLQQDILRTKTTKVTGRAESDTISNFPYNALEEALSNAVYHKNFSEEKPVEVQVFPDRIEILSFPGPLPPIKNEDLQKRRVIARDYRNRRIGDFLKELRLTEGKATGFPLIRDEMSRNGNPEPQFYTDEEKTLFLVTLPAHLAFKGTKLVRKLTTDDIDKFFEESIDFKTISRLLENDIAAVSDYVRTQIVSKSVSKSVSKLIDILHFLVSEKTREEALRYIGVSNHSKNHNTYLKPIIEAGLIEMTIPGKPTSSRQQYRITEKAKKLIQ